MRAEDARTLVDQLEGTMQALQDSNDVRRSLEGDVTHLREQLDVTRRAGQELATALWALVLAHEPRLASGLDAALAHAEEVAKRYTSQKDRVELSATLERARERSKLVLT